MNGSIHTVRPKDIKSILVPVFIAAFILFWIYMIYFAVSGKGPPGWHVGPPTERLGHTRYRTENFEVFNGGAHEVNRNDTDNATGIFQKNSPEVFLENP